jgi:hypothetical protein
MSSTPLFLEKKSEYDSVARRAIKKYGFAPEHNLDWFECVVSGTPVCVVTWKGDESLLTSKDPTAWYVHVEPLAALGHRGIRMMEYASFVLETQSDIEKIVVEVCKETLSEMKMLLPDFPHLKFRSMNYVLTWPIMNLTKFDDTLSGAHWKPMRKLMNKLRREHTLTMVEAQKVGKGMLHKIIDKWGKNRLAHDRAYPDRYHALIDSDFAGCDHAQVLIDKDIPIGINAGWLIPNSETYYGAIGVHDYSIKNIGHHLYFQDLLWMKKSGYKLVNLGGGAENSKHFKDYYQPESWYNTYNFSIVHN